MAQYLYQNLARTIQLQIEQGVLKAGDKLPSVRALTQSHSISKITALHALHSLEAKGLINVKPRSGYFVAAGIPNYTTREPALSIDAPKIIDVPDVIQDVMARGAAFDIAPHSKADSLESPYVVKLNRCIGRALRSRPSEKSLYYSDPAGEIDLKRAIATHYRKRQTVIEPEQTCITSGCQNSLFLALMAVCQPGDTVAIESPGFYGVLQLIEHLGLKVLELPASFNSGLKAETLDTAANKWNIKACILTPHFATPTGSVIPEPELTEIDYVASKHNIVIIEDDIYGDLGFYQEYKTFYSLAKHADAILCGSLSKSLSRDLRIGWVTSKNHYKKLKHLKLINQLSSSQTTQQGLTDFLQQGLYERHLFWFRKTLMNQKEKLVSVLQQHWKLDARFTDPQGGLCLWLELPKQVDTMRLYHRAKSHQLVVTPGRLFTTGDEYNNFMRLSFLHSMHGERLNALLKLGQVIQTEFT